MAKKNDKNTHGELSKIEGTVAFVLNASMIDINDAYANASVSLVDFKQMVINIINKAKVTTGQRKVIATIQSQNTKDGVIMYAYNSLLAGDCLARI